jgi:hypothetical protein
MAQKYIEQEQEDKMQAEFKVGDKVEKVGGDYTFVGVVVSVFQKLSGSVRLVVEDDRGVLHVYSEKNLRMKND